MRGVESITGLDGTHLTERGHRLYAHRYAHQLSARLGVPACVEPVPAGLPVYSQWQRRRWYLKHGALWVVRRNFDRKVRGKSGRLGAPTN